jgi:hypothetical protein
LTRACADVHLERAVLTACHLYELALYRGTIDRSLRLGYRPGA